MALVVESTSTATNASGTVTINAPSGIQAGDLLFVVVNNLDPTPTITGFSVGDTFFYDGPGLVSDCRVTTLYKTATTADETANNYTLTNSNEPTIAVMFRISGWGVGNPVLYYSFDGFNPTTSGTFSKTGLAIERTNSQLLLIVGASFDLVESEHIGNFQTYTVTSSVSNPTWTEVVDTNVDASNGLTKESLGVAYANTTESSDITGFSFGYTEYGNDYRIGALGILLVIEEPRDATGTPSLHSASPTFFSVASLVGGNAFLPAVYISPTFFSVNGTGTTMPVWSNPDKPATTWTNQTK